MVDGLRKSMKFFFRPSSKNLNKKETHAKSDEAEKSLSAQEGGEHKENHGNVNQKEKAQIQKQFPSEEVVKDQQPQEQAPTGAESRSTIPARPVLAAATSDESSVSTTDPGSSEHGKTEDQVEDKAEISPEVDDAKQDIPSGDETPLEENPKDLQGAQGSEKKEQGKDGATSPEAKNEESPKENEQIASMTAAYEGKLREKSEHISNLEGINKDLERRMKEEKESEKAEFERKIAQKEQLIHSLQNKLEEQKEESAKLMEVEIEKVNSALRSSYEKQLQDQEKTIRGLEQKLADQQTMLDEKLKSFKDDMTNQYNRKHKEYVDDFEKKSLDKEKEFEKRLEEQIQRVKQVTSMEFEALLLQKEENAERLTKHLKEKGDELTKLHDRRVVDLAAVAAVPVAAAFVVFVKSGLNVINGDV